MALSDYTIELVDLDVKRITRTFTGHQDAISDMAFSPDSRWLVSSSLDCSIRVWDLSSARYFTIFILSFVRWEWELSVSVTLAGGFFAFSLIDCFKTVSPCVSLTFSPTAEYLASVHEHDLGIFLWTNKTIYSATTLTAIPFDMEPQMLKLPGSDSSQGTVVWGVWGGGDLSNLLMSS